MTKVLILLSLVVTLIACKQKDYKRFIEISLGSAYELETQLIIAQRVNFGNQDLLNETLLNVNDEQKMLLGFGNKLNL